MALLKHIPLESAPESSPLNWKMYGDLFSLSLSLSLPPLFLSSLSPSLSPLSHLPPPSFSSLPLPFSLPHSFTHIPLPTHRSLVTRCVALVMSMVWPRAGLGGVDGWTLWSSNILPWSMDLQGTFVHCIKKMIVMYTYYISEFHGDASMSIVHFSIVTIVLCQLLQYCMLFFCLFSICLTKLDILDSFDEIKIGVAYKLDGKVLNSVPGQQNQRHYNYYAT